MLEFGEGQADAISAPLTAKAGSLRPFTPITPNACVTLSRIVDPRPTPQIQICQVGEHRQHFSRPNRFRSILNHGHEETFLPSQSRRRWSRLIPRHGHWLAPVGAARTKSACPAKPACPTRSIPKIRSGSLIFPGQSTPVIANGKLYIMGYLGEGADLQGRRGVLRRRDRQKLWQQLYNDFLSDTVYLRYATATPAIDPETGDVFASKARRESSPPSPPTGNCSGNIR